MKKILIIITLAIFALPVLATCSITGGACTPDWNTPLQQRVAPDRLQSVQNADAFQPKYVKPYEDMLINTDSPSSNYNSNCQFGVCLPGADPGNVSP